MSVCQADPRSGCTKTSVKIEIEILFARASEQGRNVDDEDEMMDGHEICYRYSFPSQD